MYVHSPCDCTMKAHFVLPDGAVLGTSPKISASWGKELQDKRSDTACYIFFFPPDRYICMKLET